MPCDTIRRSKVEFKTTTIRMKMEDVMVDLLAKALTGMGFKVKITESGKSLSFYGTHKETMQSHSGTYAGGTFASTQKSYVNPLDINKVKQAYSFEVVDFSVPDFWTLSETTSVLQQGVTQ